MLKLEIINDEFIDRYNLLLELYNRAINEDDQEYMPVLKDTSKEQDFFSYELEGIKGRPTVKLNGIFSLLDKLKYCNTIDEVIQNISSLEAFYLYILGCCRPNLNMEYKSDLSGRLGFIDCRIPYFDFKWGLINASEFIDLECALGIGHGQILLPPDIIQNLGNSLAEIQNNKTTKL